MSTGNYAYDNFVRIDCGLPAPAFTASAVHEVAHFTLAKRSSYGLLCFFLGQDILDSRSALGQTLLRLEQACECVNECYARTMELLVCQNLAAAPQQEREDILRSQRTQPYYSRYHMERLEPLLLHCTRTSQAPAFPHFLFLMAANADVFPLLEKDLTDASGIQTLLLEHPERFCPDFRFHRLTQAFARLLRKMPARRITPQRLEKESGLFVLHPSPAAMQQFFSKMAQSACFCMQVRDILKRNILRISECGFPALTAENLADSFRLSIADCVVPAALSGRFSLSETKSPVFGAEKNVLAIYMEPGTLLTPAQQRHNRLSIGARSACLHFTDTKNGVHFSNAFAEDLNQFRNLFAVYPGTVYLYLDDYSLYHSLGPFCPKPVFFRADVPWGLLRSELSAHGVTLQRFFLQRYSDSVLVFFGYDSLGNVIFSLLPCWEISKIQSAARQSACPVCGISETEQYGAHGWRAFRDVIAAAAEDSEYGSLSHAAFRARRLL